MIGLLVLVVVGVLFAITLGFDEVSPELSPIPPERFPQLVLALMAVLAVALALAPRAAGEKAKLPRRMYATAACLSAFVLAQGIVGTFPTIVGFLLVTPRLFGERRFFPVLLYALALAAAVYLLFVALIGVRLP